MAHDDSLDLGAGIPIFRKESGPLTPKLATHIRLGITLVELAAMSRCVHHEMRLRAMTIAWISLTLATYLVALSRGRGHSLMAMGRRHPIESVRLGNDVYDNSSVLWQKCLVVDFLPLVDLTHLGGSDGSIRWYRVDIAICTRVLHGLVTFVLLAVFSVRRYLDPWESEILQMETPDEVK